MMAILEIISIFNFLDNKLDLIGFSIVLFDLNSLVFTKQTQITFFKANKMRKEF